MSKYKYDAEQIVRHVRGWYGDKYSEEHYRMFIDILREQNVTTKRALISAIENWFDIDTRDAKECL